MPQDPEHGRRFAEDMRRIREAHNLTVSDLHEETKIPQGLIEAFEEKALFDHPQFNRVYLRSFVRTYAQVVDIDADVALDGLEEALSGRYAGSLAVEYLGAEPEAVSGVPEEPEEALDESDSVSAEEATQGAEPEQPTEPREAGEAEPPVVSGETPEPRDEAKRPSDAGVEESRALTDVEDEEADAEDEDAGPSYVTTTQSTAAGFQETTGAEGAVADEPSQEWTAQSPPPGTPQPSPGRTPSRTGPDRRWFLGGALVVVVGLIVWILASVLGGSDAPEPVPSIAGDTTETVESPDAAASAGQTAEPVNIPSLGDTMNVWVVAAHGKVDPIRVTVDDDLRRPYWIEAGDSLAFRPTSRIVVEELLDSVDVKVEGIEYPTSRRDQQGRVVITRDTAQAYFSSLQAGQ